MGRSVHIWFIENPATLRALGIIPACCRSTHVDNIYLLTKNNFIGCFCGMCKVDKCFIGLFHPLAALPKPLTCAASTLPSSAVYLITALYFMIKIQLIQQYQDRHGLDVMDPVVVVAIFKMHSSEENGMFQLQLCKN